MSPNQIAIANRQNNLTVSTQAIEAFLQEALQQEGCTASLDVAIVDDEKMTELNDAFLGHKRPTDVLAFPYETSGKRFDGEIVINADQAIREAEERSHTSEDELFLYIAHGLLHLLGYDDRDEEQRHLMREKERLLLKTAGRQIEF